MHFDIPQAFAWADSVLRQARAQLHDFGVPDTISTHYGNESLLLYLLARSHKFGHRPSPAFRVLQKRPMAKHRWWLARRCPRRSRRVRAGSWANRDSHSFRIVPCFLSKAGVLTRRVWSCTIAAVASRMYFVREGPWWKEEEEAVLDKTSCSIAARRDSKARFRASAGRRRR